MPVPANILTDYIELGGLGIIIKRMRILKTINDHKSNQDKSNHEGLKKKLFLLKQ